MVLSVDLTKLGVTLDTSGVSVRMFLGLSERESLP